MSGLPAAMTGSWQYQIDDRCHGNDEQYSEYKGCDYKTLDTATRKIPLFVFPALHAEARLHYAQHHPPERHLLHFFCVFLIV